jgi:uncharacterized membrane protein YccC
MPERYQEEIEEILKGIEDTPPKETRSGAVERNSSEVYRSIRYQDTKEVPPAPPKRRWRPTLSSGKLALAGLVLILLWLFLHWNMLIWIGLALLVGAYLLFFVKPRRPYGEKIWRGRPMEDKPSPWDRFKRWLRS